MPDSTRKGLPGGVALPAAVLALSLVAFAICWRHPDLVDLGPHFSPAGMGVLGAALSLFWLLVAVGKR